MISCWMYLPEQEIKEQTFLATNDTNDSITWAIKDDSNLNNQTGANGIEPGSSGSLTFYIISHKDGPLSLTLDVTLTGYSYSGKDDNEPTTSADIKKLDSDGKAQKLLEGHVLLFAEYDTKYYKNWISKDAEEWNKSLGEECFTVQRQGWKTDLDSGKCSKRDCLPSDALLDLAGKTGILYNEC